MVVVTPLLRRYILRRMGISTVAVGAAVIGAAVCLDGLERASLLLARGLDVGTAAAYLGLRQATVAHLLLPLIACLAAALAVAGLRHRGEWDAMRSLGAAPGHLRLPFLAVGIALAALLLAYEGFGLPRALELAARYEASAVLGGAARLGTGDQPRWWRLDDGLLVAREVSIAGDRLSGVSWFTTDDLGEVTARRDSAELVHDGDGWRFSEGDLWSFGPGPDRLERDTEDAFIAGLTPGGIRRRLLPLAQHDLPTLERDPRPEARYTLHARLAHPLSAGLLVVLASLLATAAARGRAMAVAAALGAFVIVALMDLLASAVAPALGWAWCLPWVTPTVVAAAVYLTWKYDASERNQPLVQSA